jgi:hypothetical protein
VGFAAEIAQASTIKLGDARNNSMLILCSSSKRAIAHSELATEYAAYKARVRRFIPRLRRDSAVRPDLQ